MTIDSIKKNQTNEDNKKDDKVNTVDTLTKQIKHLTIGMCVLGIATGFSIFQNYEIKEKNEENEIHIEDEVEEIVCKSNIFENLP